MVLDLRTPKGTRDYSPDECSALNKLVESITCVFEKHGAVSIDTPIFELRDVLCNKYGEDSKLIFDLADQGGDICSLRYDLTVSFARYLAKNKIQKIKRFQIGKVFRRDQPSFSKGRLREFIQCDFDIAGSYLRMVPDAELLHILGECLDKMNLGYQIKVSSRLVLNAIMRCAEVPENKFLNVCSSIDKLDKVTWKEVVEELLSKGLDNIKVAKLEKYVKMKGTKEMLCSLRQERIYLDDEGKRGIEDLELLSKYLEIYGMTSKVLFDLSLARGLEYYTGIIFEAVLLDFRDMGAIAGGGRYDRLVSSVLYGGGEKVCDVPCVGFSFGVTRILPILMEKHGRRKVSKTMVFVGSSGALLLEERLKVMHELWSNDIPSETFYTKRYSFGMFLQHTQREDIPFLLVIGEKEVEKGQVKLLYGANKTQNMLKSINDAITFIKSQMGVSVSEESIIRNNRMSGEI